MCHDFKHEAVGDVHATASDGSQVVYASVYVILDNALDGGDIVVLYGEHGAHDGCAYA